MTLPSSPRIDSRQALQLLADLLARRNGYVPEWQPEEGDQGLALGQIAARYLQTLIQRLNMAPDKNKLAFLDLMGIRLIPAQAARTPVVFRLAEKAVDIRVPAGTRLAAPPPPEQNTQIIFETERSTGVAAARLEEVFSLWPGRDQYIDHTQDFLSGQTFRPFLKSQLQDVEHILYLAHDRLLALSGKVMIKVNFNLTTAGSEWLDILWEYWDGKVWREFLFMSPECDNEEANRLDTTGGLTHSGFFLLQADCADSAKKSVNGVEGRWIRGRLTEPLPPDPAQVLPEVDSITLSTTIQRPLILEDSVSEQSIDVLTRKPFFSGASFNDANTLSSSDVHVREGLLPDAAFGDGVVLNLTQPFYPLGMAPQPGATFYFSSEEAFSKPGATVVILVRRTITPADLLNNPSAGGGGNPKSPIEHTVNWEYWDGSQWKDILPPFKNTSPGDPLDLNDSGYVMLTVPKDMEKTTVNGQEALWMRVRLISGGYGFTQDIPIQAGGAFTIIVPQPPALSDFRLGYSWTDGPYRPDTVFTYNDFQYHDRTEEAKWEGQTFQPFTPPGDTTPALYLGFNQKLPVDRLGIYFDLLEQPGDSLGPALLWQYWDGIAWQDLSVEDETRYLRISGIVSLIGPEDSQPLARFGSSLFWLRARLKEDGPPGEPFIQGLYPNAVWASQIQTIVDQPIGASTGQSNQVFQFIQFPVLDGEQVEVRELAGPRANVEWRMIAMEVFASDIRQLQEAESLLLSEGPQLEIQMGDLRLRRDRAKRVTEVWVRWRSQPNLLFSAANSRDYIVDRARGRLIFGDGEHGKTPPPGAAVLARQYRAGGGLMGNIRARKLAQVLGPIGGLEEAFNPVPASGGADGETPESLLERGSQTLRRRGRALSLRDFETMACESSASVAFARALPCCDPAGRTVPGWVTVVIFPQSGDARPWPSFGLREQVRTFIGKQAAAALAGGAQISVTGPNYRPVDVEATIAPIDFSEAGAVEQSTRHALETFLHPLRGGPSGRGWEPGRDVYLSDVSAVLEKVAGVDFVKELALLVDGGLQGEHVSIPEGQTVVAGQIRIKLVQGEI
jgi:hypothetical protein